VGQGRIFDEPRPCNIEIEYVLRDDSKTGALVAMETKYGNRFNVEDDLICALSCIESRISFLSNNKQVQPSVWLYHALWC